MHRALGGGHAECARFLLENGADPNKADALKRTPLHWASMGPPPDNVECCTLVFEKGDGPAMLLKETKSGSTPLHSAAGTNRPDVVRFLVEKQADQTLKDEDGLTPFELAKKDGFTEIVQILKPSGTAARASSGGGGGGGDGGSGFFALCFGNL